VIAGCGHGSNLWSRSAESGYAGANPAPSRKISERERFEQQKALAEFGVDPELAGAGDLNQKIQTRGRLRALEKSLSNRREMEQYYKYGSWLKDDEERVRFLELDSYESRQAFVRANKIGARPDNPPAEMQALIESEDVALGMHEDWVRKSWGDPKSVEVSGHPAFKNEKWKYSRYVASPDGYRMQNRTLYFEGGRVVGWDSE
jgi:hypothetical protein